MSDKVLIIGSDCHAGALPSIYNEYMPSKYHEAANTWWVTYTREMMSRVGRGNLAQHDEGADRDLPRLCEEDIRAILGLNAAKVYGFDVDALSVIAQEIGPSIAQIRDEV